MKGLVISTTAVAVFPLFSSVIASSCPPLGAVLSPPQAPSQNKAVKLANQKLKSAIESSYSSKLNTSGISIMVKSIHEDGPLFSYHFTPPVLSDIGTAAIDENTIFRVGSLSKIFPALAALQSNSIHTDDSVLKYIPELKNVAATGSAEAIPWEDITVDSLMTHLSGLATDSKSSLNSFFFFRRGILGKLTSIQRLLTWETSLFSCGRKLGYRLFLKALAQLVQGFPALHRAQKVTLSRIYNRESQYICHILALLTLTSALPSLEWSLMPPRIRAILTISKTTSSTLLI